MTLVLKDLRGFETIRAPVVIAIGSFDGVHIGHQAVVGCAVESARARGGQAWVLTLDPHPLKILRPQLAPPLLTTTEQKVRLLASLGITGSIVLNFDRPLAAQEPEDFFEELQSSVPTLTELVVGCNWTFGRGARGTPDLLAQLGREHGCAVRVLAPVHWNGAPVSSTRVRQAVADGRLEEAAGLLGRPFSVAGPVVPGKQFGRAMGFPTVNVTPRNEVRPPPGVYGARTLIDGRRFDGAVFRPDHAAETTPAPLDLFEMFIFDFNGDLYGRELELSLLFRHRENRRFATTEALREQISRDVIEIRARLAAEAGQAPG